MASGKILLTGATGYVGGRLLPELESRGYPLRCLARRPEFLRAKAAASTEVFQGDLLEEESVRKAMRGVETAFYLAHSMGSKGSFDDEEARTAGNFAKAAREAGVRKIIYLGGLSHDSHLSPHLKSRAAVGEILRQSGVPVVEFRASIIIGSGSASFELIRSLIERLPVMTTPKWVRSLAQPIAIEDVICYLVEAISFRTDHSRIFEIGGPERLSYLDLMREYGRQRGLRRLILPVPVLTPGLSSLWLGLVTPLYARVGRKLIESIRHDTVVEDSSALTAFSVRPMRVKQAIARALVFEDRAFALTRWSDALSSSYSKPVWGGRVSGSRIMETRSETVSASPNQVFEVVSSIGGKNGWYGTHWIWKVRAYLDLLAGGVGIRRGRPEGRPLRAGDTLDWWRVEAVERGKLLRLAAEMKLPGRAWVQFEIQPEGGGTRLCQTAIFDPRGLSGRIYWYTLYPVHRWIFRSLARGIARRAQSG